jgi:predicted phosphodiesterase
MRLLLTSDLHRDGVKLSWLLDQAPPYDALLVAGDVLDIFADDGLVRQGADLLRWRQAVISKGKSFAWCSGNHDFFYSGDTQMTGASPLWMKEVPSSGISVTDGET